MTEHIPFFYYDIQARLLPGGLTLALLMLGEARLPGPWQKWLDWLHGPGGAQTVLVPIVYAGGAYAIGLALDALLNRFLRPFFRRGFARALRSYEWRAGVGGKDNGRTYSIDQLGKWTFDYYLVRTTRDAKEELPHMIRFHSEAKLFFHCAVVLSIALLATLVGYVRGISVVPSIQASPGLQWVIALSASLCFLGAQARATRRAEQILSFLDQFGGIAADVQLRELVSTLQASQKHRPPNNALQPAADGEDAPKKSSEAGRG